jgi:hypothetical protein
MHPTTITLYWVKRDLSNENPVVWIGHRTTSYYHHGTICRPVLMKEGSFTAWLWANRESLGLIPAPGNPSKLVSWTPMAKESATDKR